ncbi:hypothetical protein [Sphingopyxis sp.]|uniref:hypothetical protein n=1 Tax=Sphingopyxis sp. TaxID=1908224 RepID=UPI002D7F9556|nr:hypothetical protein [Sphingopyxis sp.]
MGSLSALSIRSLLRMHSGVGDELRSRQVCRTSNNPAGDIAEHLFSHTFGWELQNNSKAGFDAACGVRGRIQIKCRRVTGTNPSRQAGDIRDLERHRFDWLAGVVFDEGWDVILGMLIPHELVVQRALPITHSRSSRIYLQNDWLSVDGVVDVTGDLQQGWSLLAGSE